MYIQHGIILLVGLAVMVTSYGHDQCYTPNSYPGQCVSLHECTAMLNFIEARKANGLTSVEQEFITESKCHSITGTQEQVCCNNDDPFLKTEVTTSASVIESTQSPTDGDGLLPNPAEKKCGRDIFSDRIYGGRNTELGEFPWMALLEYQNAMGVKDFACGGSLINERYVLTAAHCLVGKIEQAKGRLINIRLGEHNLNTTEDCETHEGTQICADPVRDISVDRIIPHPDYIPDDRNQYHDIGLVRLGQTVPLSEYIFPICLPSVQIRVQTGDNVTIAGWGRTLYSRKSVTKQQLSIAIVDQEICKDKFGTIRRKPVEIKETQLCAGGEFKRDSCDGDSGGPLMYFTGSLWYAKGLVSFGNGCGFDGWPGVYTRVSEYVVWIRSVLEP